MPTILIKTRISIKLVLNSYVCFFSFPLFHLYFSFSLSRRLTFDFVYPFSWCLVFGSVGVVLFNSLKNLDFCIDCDSPWIDYSLSCVGSSGKYSSKINKITLKQTTTKESSKLFEPIANKRTSKHFIRWTINRWKSFTDTLDG